MEEMENAMGQKGCGYCGGLGHRMAQCPRLAKFKQSEIKGAQRKDYLGAGGYGGEM